jgi:hypothetical protein
VVIYQSLPHLNLIQKGLHSKHYHQLDEIEKLDYSIFIVLIKDIITTIADCFIDYVINAAMIIFTIATYSITIAIIILTISN